MRSSGAVLVGVAVAASVALAGCGSDSDDLGSSEEWSEDTGGEFEEGLDDQFDEQQEPVGPQAAIDADAAEFTIEAYRRGTLEFAPTDKTTPAAKADGTRDVPRIDVYALMMTAPSGARAAMEMPSMGDGMAVAVGDDFIDVSWDPSRAGGDTVEVYRNNVLVAEGLQGSAFRDTGVTPGVVYDYRVELCEAVGSSKEPSDDEVAGAEDAESICSFGVIGEIPESGNIEEILDWPL